MKKALAIIFFLIFILGGTALHAQYLESVHTLYSDSFREWTIYDLDENEGYIKQQWILRDNWTEWEYELGDISGQIKLKWQDNPNEWEVRGDGEVISVKTLWRNDFTEWRLDDGTHRITFRSLYTNNANIWTIREKTFGPFSLETEWNNDPRDWIIYDELDADISPHMKMAMVFIAIFQSSPKL